MDNSRKSVPDFLVDRRKAIKEKALERQKAALRKREQQSKVVGPWPPLQGPAPPNPSAIEA